MKKIVFLMVLLTSFSGRSQHAEVFDAANEAYSEGNYREAVEKYKAILEDGETSAALHYNLGNAYYKLNEIGRSIYQYEKALQLDPGDEDIRNNLEFARNMAVDDIEKDSLSGFARIFESTTSAFTPEGWGWIGIICMLVFVFFILTFYFSKGTTLKRIFFIGGIFFFILAISSVVIAMMKVNLVQERQYAIVLAEEAEIRSEPNLRSAENFLLHEGAKVRVTETYQEWFEIEIPNGSQGWILQEAVKKL